MDKYKCPECGRSFNDLSQGLGNIRNYYCVCGYHIYNGIHYTKKQWTNYVETVEQQ